ncbi:MAG: hypothetical protein ACT6QS_02965 [Flavobacteriales bacterium]
MKPMIIFSTLLLVVTTACKSNRSSDLSTPPSETSFAFPKAQKGTRLIYLYANHGIRSRLDITIQRMDESLAFDYSMNLMDNPRGHVTVSQAALKSANSFEMVFPLEKPVAENQSSLLLSQMAFRDLLEAGETVLDLGSGLESYFFAQNEEVAFSYNSKVVFMTCMKCSNLDKTGEVWILKNPAFPIIVKMNRGVSIELDQWIDPAEVTETAAVPVSAASNAG